MPRQEISRSKTMLKRKPTATLGQAKTRQRQMIWTVPLGKTLYVTQITFTACNMGSTKYARFTTKATYDDKSATVLAAGLFFMPYTEAGLMNDIYVQGLKASDQTSGNHRHQSNLRHQRHRGRLDLRPSRMD